jgi:hypothetical protein
MQNWPNVQTKKITEIEPGTCFAFDLKQQTYIGIAVEPASKGVSALVAVSPGHPQLNGKPGIFNASVVQGQTLLVFPDAKIILPSSPEHIHVGLNSISKPLGALFLQNETLGIAASDGLETWVFDVANGEALQGEFYRSVWFSAWEIAIQGPDGEMRTLCRVTTDKPVD